MNNKQRAAAYRLLAAVESEPELKEEAPDYGNWYLYLYEHILRIRFRQLKQQLSKPVNSYLYAYS